jgi:hypothetical protein
MLSDTLSEVHWRLVKDLEHYTTGTFRNYYSESFRNEIRSIIQRIDELRTFLDTPPKNNPRTGSADFNYFLIVDSKAIQNGEVNRNNFILINTNASKMTVEASLNMVINNTNFDYLDALKSYLESKEYFCQILFFDINNQRNIIDLSNLF